MAVLLVSHIIQEPITKRDIPDRNAVPYSVAIQQSVLYITGCRLRDQRPDLQMVCTAEDSPQLLPVLLLQPAVGYGVENPADRN